MITIATGIIQDEDSIGLVGCHAYGVLEIVECEGHRLMLVKNPWGHFRWKGKFAYGDANWTPSLKKALGYDNFSQDKGVFWINFESTERASLTIGRHRTCHTLEHCPLKITLSIS
jgi:hypothetical protein